MGARVQMAAVGWERDLEVDVVEPPTPGRDQVVIAVEACGVCHRDILDRSGRFPFLRTPITPGHEAVGRVLAVGADVQTWQVGDRVGTMHRDACGDCPPCRQGEPSLCSRAAWVFGLLVDGGYAEHLIARPAALFSVPVDLTAPEAAVMHCTFGTAYRNLVTAGGLRATDKVVVIGANGGVGSAAIQIASRAGAETIAVVRREGHEAYLLGLGADRVVVSPDGAFHKDPATAGATLALDCVGAATFNGSLRCLGLGGRLAVVGNIDPARAELNLGYVIVRALQIFSAGGATPADMAEVFALHAEAPFRVPIDRTLVLDRADEAQRSVRAGGLRGRIVLIPPSRLEAS
jgi:acryloyl-coenzyme A reductase